jgi:hypothetical protein
MGDPILIRGPLFLWTETGTEGGYWAIQDERLIEPATDEWPHERWSYEGLFVFKDGDHLKIFDPDGGVYWEGLINLKPLPLFTEDAYGLWIHADQIGLNRELWALPFFKAYRGELTRGA